MINPNSDGHPELDAFTGDDVDLREDEAIITDTYPKYVIDGIELSDVQSREYQEILADCGGNQKLCQEVWRLSWINDGEQWLSMDTMQYMEADPELMAELEGSSADAYDGLTKKDSRVRP